MVLWDEEREEKRKVNGERVDGRARERERDEYKSEERRVTSSVFWAR